MSGRFVVYSMYVSDALANFPALVATSTVSVLHVCCIAHSWLPQRTILVNGCNSGDKGNCQNNTCLFAVPKIISLTILGTSAKSL